MDQTTAATGAGFDPARLERVNQWLRAQVADERVAGCSVHVERRGQVALSAATGLADLDTGQAFSTDTIVRLYSMTKAVTTVAAMLLYEEGAFQLDDPIAKWLPAFADTPVWLGGELDNTESQDSPILVRHLMTHTSGLTYGFMQTNVVDAEHRARHLAFPGGRGDLAAAVEELASIPLLCQPGAQWNYSVSIDVLGRLVEIWSGQSLGAFFRTRIFEPLGMTDTGFQVPADQEDRFAACYAPLHGPSMADVASAGPAAPGEERQGGIKLQEAVTGSPFLAPPVVEAGGGGLVGTLGDYAAFCRMLMNGGELDGQRLLSPVTLAHMRRNHLPGNADMAAMGQPVWSETSYDGIGFGLGWAVVLDPVTANIVTSPGEHHWGGAASTFFWLDPAQELFVVFLTQLMPSSTWPIRRELRQRVYQAIVA